MECLEKAWTTWMNSDAFRRFAKYGIGSSLMKSRAFREINLTRRHLTTCYKVHKNPGLFEEVHAFCLFVGNNKSGSSMLGSILDAHRNVILADEEDALQYIPAGFRRDQIFHILLRGSRREMMKGRVTARRLGAYSFQVPGQWQGRYEKIKVIGDTTTGTTTRRLAQDPGLLGQMRAVMADIPVKLIQVIRNPFDTISYLMVRGKRTFANAIDYYFTNCQTIVELRDQLDEAALLPVKYEDFVLHPREKLEMVCTFLGIDSDEDYLSACTEILHPEPHQNRQMITWESKWIDQVQYLIDQFAFLEGYSYLPENAASISNFDRSLTLGRS
jgi:hypothetical protein